MGEILDLLTVSTILKIPMKYGLQTAFSEIERLSHQVTDAGNPIAMDLKTRYVLKGIGKEQTIASKILIYYDQATGKITKLQDKWDGQLPDSSFKNVSLRQLFSPWWWFHYGEGWAWWMWSFTWDTWWWQVCERCLLTCHRHYPNAGFLSELYIKLSTVADH